MASNQIDGVIEVYVMERDVPFLISIYILHQNVRFPDARSAFILAPRRGRITATVKTKSLVHL